MASALDYLLLGTLSIKLILSCILSPCQPVKLSARRMAEIMNDDAFHGVLTVATVIKKDHHIKENL